MHEGRRRQQIYALDRRASYTLDNFIQATWILDNTLALTSADQYCEWQPEEEVVCPEWDQDLPLSGEREGPFDEPLHAVECLVGTGEVGLYESNTFESADAILDYVQYGAAGQGRATAGTDRDPRLWSVDSTGPTK